MKQFKEMQKLMKRIPGLSGTKKAKGKAKGKGKGKKGGRPGRRRAPAPAASPELPKQPFTLPGLN